MRGSGYVLLNRFFFFNNIVFLSPKQFSSFSIHRTFNLNNSTTCFFFFYSSSSSSAPLRTLQDPCNKPTLHRRTSESLNEHRLSYEQTHAVKLSSEVDYSRTTVFRKFGCTDAEITKILYYQPKLLRSDLTILQSKLRILHTLGFTGSDLVTILRHRPRFFATAFGKGLDERLEFLQMLFGSKPMILKAVIWNPFLLSYDVDKVMKPCLAMYEELGISKKDFTSLLMNKQNLISRSSLTKEKLDYLHKIGISMESRMYKYVVSVIALSRLETIQEKVTNFESFGFSFEEVMGLFCRSPYAFTLSVEKVQRNMTYIIGTMKLPANIALAYPFLLTSSLDRLLKPRFVLSTKIESMGLSPQIKGPALLRALKMTEPRFLRAFVECHEKDVAELLMDIYMEAKGSKRLAADSRVVAYRGFPF